MTVQRTGQGGREFYWSNRVLSTVYLAMQRHWSHSLKRQFFVAPPGRRGQVLFDHVQSNLHLPLQIECSIIIQMPNFALRLKAGEAKFYIVNVAMHAVINCHPADEESESFMAREPYRRGFLCCYCLC